jgi:N-acetylneuraminic acid mutarotase
MYAGVNRGWIILAGGSNFPVPRSAGGTKSYSREIYVRPATAASRHVGWSVDRVTLPIGLAEGASVATDHGVACVGGQSSAGPVADAFILFWDGKGSTVRQRRLPELPAACANAAAVYWDGSVYVAGGESNGQGLAHFWKLDLAAAMAAPNDTAWKSLPMWPGPRRFGAVLSVLWVQKREQLFLFGGRTQAVGPAVLEDYLQDAYRFDPAAGRWTELGPMPHRALLAASMRLDASRVAILGGSDGHSLDRMAELGERYRIPDRIMIYDAEADRWSAGGRMPIGVVAPAVVELDSGWLVAGGEYSPGLRTAQVYRVVLSSGQSQRNE